jgi:arylsulfatase A-like enzyme/tetratricopeptide (TPR) repeat protein
VAAGLAVGAAAAIGWRWSGGTRQADLRRIPGQNVLLITIDTLRADAMSSYGGPAVTPALDDLARDGVRFTFAHAHAVLTLPSHASILTGRYPYQHGIRDNSGYRMPAGLPTLATLLKRAGYATGAFVGAFPLHSRFGLNQGFDVYDDRFGETQAPTELVMPERPASAVVPLAREWIAAAARRNGAEPWFAWVHLFDPHAPYQPPPPFDRDYAGREYFGEVAAVDHALAPLLDDIRASSRPTIVIVTGDHGEALGDHGETTHGLFAYEATLRIPLIITELPRVDPVSRPPGAPGEVSEVSARHVDLLPTVLDAVGQPIPADLPGRTLLPAAERRGPTNASASRTSYFEAMASMLNRGWAPLQGVLVDRQKYIDLPITELYDLAHDPGEQSNLSGRAGDRERTLQASLRGFGASPPGQRANEDPDAAARLRSLGYVSGQAASKTRYTEADDPKRLIDLDRAIHRGVELYSAKHLDEAARVYRDLIGRRPGLAVAYQHLAFVDWQMGDVGSAVLVLQQALAAGVHHTDLTVQLGTYLAESGRAGEAIPLLEAVAREAPSDVDVINALGIAYARGERSGEARQMFERALALDRDGNMALENLGAIDLDQGQLAAARQHFERAVIADARSSQAHAGLAVVAFKSGDRKAAISAWTTAVELEPTNYDALYDLATTLEQEGQWEAARPYVERFVRSAPRALYARDITELSRWLQERH